MSKLQLLCSALLLVAATPASAITLSNSKIPVYTGEVSTDQAGRAVAMVGDVNNDGYDDLLIGAYDDDDGGNHAGAVYLIYGQSTALTSRSLSTAVKFWGEDADDFVGGAGTNSAGDLNRDGYDDILIGAMNDDDGGADAGAVYIIYGQASALTSRDLATADVKLTGEAASDNAGTSTASAGDVNNDGYDDILIGAQDNGSSRGAAYLVYGQSAHLSSGSLSTAIKFSAETDGAQAGYDVASAGDVNRDGYSDFMVADRDSAAAASAAGAVYLIYGQQTALASASLGTKIRFTGTAASNEAGNSIGSGDFNNDGYSDLVIGAPGNGDAASTAGAVYIFFGQSSALSSASLSTALEFTGTTAGHQTGWSVSSEGRDVNQDGYDDIMIGTQTGNITYLLMPLSARITITNNTAPYNTVACPSGSFSDPSATAVDVFTGNSLSVSAAGSVTSTVLGAYTITYTAAANTFNFTSNATRTVNVTDTVVPTITLTGSATLVQEVGGTYTDAGATASDACDSSVGVTTAGSVDTATLGDYTLTYSASDDSSNAATQVTRTVTVADTTDPVITLTGDSTVTIYRYSEYIDAGASAVDAFAGDLTADIVTTNGVDNTVPGTYTVDYTVTDSSGNTDTVTRTVTVLTNESISTLIKSNSELTIVYADGNLVKFNPFGAHQVFRSAVVSATNHTVIVSDGKTVKLYEDNTLLDSLTIAKKRVTKLSYLHLSVGEFYGAYSSGFLVSTKPNLAKLTAFRITTGNTLTSQRTVSAALANRRALNVQLQPAKHRITVTVGRNPKTTLRWKLLTSGKLRQLL